MGKADDGARCAPCGTNNQSGSRFCRGCGSALTPELPPQGDRRWKWLTVSLVGATLLVVAAIVVVLRSDPDSGEATGPGSRADGSVAAPAPALSVDDVELSLVEESTITVEAGELWARAGAVVALEGGDLVMVGFGENPAGELAPYTPLAWWSDDLGQSWVPADVEDPERARGETSSSEVDTRMSGVVSTADGLLATGIRSGEPRFWGSSDQGRTWSVLDGARIDGYGAEGLAIADPGTVGGVGRSDFIDNRPLTWLSEDDGDSWTTHPIDPSAEAGVDTVAVSPGGTWVASGVRLDLPGTPPTTWTSSDARAWEVMDDAPTGGVYSAVAVGDGLVAAASAQAGGPAALWTFTETSGWRDTGLLLPEIEGTGSPHLALDGSTIIGMATRSAATEMTRYVIEVS